MGVYAPVVQGTWTFVSIAAGLSLLTLFGRCIGVVSKDTAAISVVLYTLAAFCTWLLWCAPLLVVACSDSRARRLCAWMHQLHPLLIPEYEGND